MVLSIFVSLAIFMEITEWSSNLHIRLTN